MRVFSWPELTSLAVLQLHSGTVNSVAFPSIESHGHRIDQGKTSRRNHNPSAGSNIRDSSSSGSDSEGDDSVSAQSLRAFSSQQGLLATCAADRRIAVYSLYPS